MQRKIIESDQLTSYLHLCLIMIIDSLCVEFDGLKTTSKRLADRKIEKFDKNITKRGFVPETTTKKGKDYPVGPILLGFFVFVVIGSCESSSSSLFHQIASFRVQASCFLIASLDVYKFFSRFVLVRRLRPYVASYYHFRTSPLTNYDLESESFDYICNVCINRVINLLVYFVYSSLPDHQDRNQWRHGIKT